MLLFIVESVQSIPPTDSKCAFIKELFSQGLLQHILLCRTIWAGHTFQSLFIVLIGECAQNCERKKKFAFSSF